MFTTTINNLNLKEIAESGQCFRWKEKSENTFSVVAFGRYLEIQSMGNNEFSFSCDSNEWESIWKKYFDIDTDYEEISRLILSSDDEYLKTAYKSGAGIRILQQDLWEIIVSFIISQNNNIKRIRNSIEMLCRRCGKEIEGHEGEYRFPLPGEVEDSIFYEKEMGFGYRSDYLKGIYDLGLNNPEWVENLKELSYEEAMEELLKIKGIGRKVANCICLFGLHHVDAFPIDTHIKQILDVYYPNGYDYGRYAGVNGIIQQYMFYNSYSSQKNKSSQ